MHAVAALLLQSLFNSLPDSCHCTAPAGTSTPQHDMTSMLDPRSSKTKIKQTSHGIGSHLERSMYTLEVMLLLENPFSQKASRTNELATTTVRALRMYGRERIPRL